MAIPDEGARHNATAASLAEKKKKKKVVVKPKPTTRFNPPGEEKAPTRSTPTTTRFKPPTKTKAKTKPRATNALDAHGRQPPPKMPKGATRATVLPILDPSAPWTEVPEFTLDATVMDKKKGKPPKRIPTRNMRLSLPMWEDFVFSPAGLSTGQQATALKYNAEYRRRKAAERARARSIEKILARRDRPTAGRAGQQSDEQYLRAQGHIGDQSIEDFIKNKKRDSRTHLPQIAAAIGEGALSSLHDATYGRVTGGLRRASTGRESEISHERMTGALTEIGDVAAGKSLMNVFQGEGTNAAYALLQGLALPVAGLKGFPMLGTVAYRAIMGASKAEKAADLFASTVKGVNVTRAERVALTKKGVLQAPNKVTASSTPARILGDAVDTAFGRNTALGAAVRNDPRAPRWFNIQDESGKVVDKLPGTYATARIGKAYQKTIDRFRPYHWGKVGRTTVGRIFADEAKMYSKLLAQQYDISAMRYTHAAQQIAANTPKNWFGQLDGPTLYALRMIGNQTSPGDMVLSLEGMFNDALAKRDFIGAASHNVHQGWAKEAADLVKIDPITNAVIWSEKATSKQKRLYAAIQRGATGREEVLSALDRLSVEAANQRIINASLVWHGAEYRKTAEYYAEVLDKSPNRKVLVDKYGEDSPYIVALDGMAIRWTTHHRQELLNQAATLRQAGDIAGANEAEAMAARGPSPDEFYASVKEVALEATDAEMKQLIARHGPDVRFRGGPKFTGDEAFGPVTATNAAEAEAELMARLTPEKLALADDIVRGLLEKHGSRNLTGWATDLHFPGGYKPTTIEEWLTYSVRRMIALNDSAWPGRDWYKRSADRTLASVGGDMARAERLIALEAILSARNEVNPNLGAALKALRQHEAGKPVKVATGLLNEEAQYLLDNGVEAWAAKYETIKRSNFFKNILEEVNPERAHQLFPDAHDVTVDRWMYYIFGFDRENQAQAYYGLISDATKALADAYGVQPKEVQAAAWVAIKKLEVQFGTAKKPRPVPLDEATAWERANVSFLEAYDRNPQYNAMLTSSVDEAKRPFIEEFLREAGMPFSVRPVGPKTYSVTLHGGSQYSKQTAAEALKAGKKPRIDAHQKQLFDDVAAGVAHILGDSEVAWTRVFQSGAVSEDKFAVIKGVDSALFSEIPQTRVVPSASGDTLLVYEGKPQGVKGFKQAVEAVAKEQDAEVVYYAHQSNKIGDVDAVLSKARDAGRGGRVGSVDRLRAAADEAAAGTGADLRTREGGGVPEWWANPNRTSHQNNLAGTGYLKAENIGVEFADADEAWESLYNAVGDDPDFKFADYAFAEATGTVDDYTWRESGKTIHGFFNPEANRIALSPSDEAPNITGIHEFFHRALATSEKHPNPRLIADETVDLLAKHVGVKNGKWTPALEERAVATLEAVFLDFREGTSNMNPKLVKAFEEIRKDMVAFEKQHPGTFADASDELLNDLPDDLRESLEDLFWWIDQSKEGFHGARPMSRLGQVYLPEVEGLPVKFAGSVVTQNGRNVRKLAQGIEKLQESDDSLRHMFTGALIRSGRWDKDITKGSIQSVIKAGRIDGMHTVRERALKIGSEIPPDSPNLVAVAEDPENIPSELRKKVNALKLVFEQMDSGKKISAQEMDSFTEKEIETLKEHLFLGINGMDDELEALATSIRRGTRAPIPGVKWVRRETLLDTGLFNEPQLRPGGYGKKLVSGTDALNNALKIAVLSGNPAYYPMNMMGQAGLLTVQQLGLHRPMGPIRAARLRSQLGQDAAFLDLIGGVGQASVLRSPGGAGKKVVDAFADAGNFLIDKYPRGMAVMYEAQRLGYRNAEQLRSLMFDPRYVDDLRIVMDRSRKAMVDFNNLSPFEKELISRLIFVYPWLKASTYWTARFPLDHPFQAALFAAGLYLQQQRLRDHFPDGVPGYMDFALPLNENEESVFTMRLDQLLPAFQTIDVAKQGLAAFGLGDLSMPGLSMLGGEEGLSSMLQPLLQAGLNTLAGQDTFTGQEVEKSVLGFLSQLDPRERVVAFKKIQDAIQGANSGLYPMSKVQEWLRVFLGSLTPINVDPDVAAVRAARVTGDESAASYYEWIDKAEKLLGKPLNERTKQLKRNAQLYDREQRKLYNELGRGLTPQENALAALRAYIAFTESGKKVNEEAVMALSDEKAEAYAAAVREKLGYTEFGNIQEYLGELAKQEAK